MRCLVSSVPYRVNPSPVEPVRPAGLPGFQNAGQGTSAYVAYELARLRSLLQHLGHEVIAVDVAHYRRSQVIGLLKESTPDVVIVDATSFQDHTERHLLLQYFLLVKAVSPTIRTVWGGRDASALAHFALTHSLVVDAVLCDESDSTLPPLLERWEESGPGAPLQDLPGLATRIDGTVHRARRLQAGELVELDTLPFLDYGGMALAEGAWPLIMSSRGCPYSCRFCYRQYRERRCHSVPYFIDHLNYLFEEFGYRRFRIDDELFTFDRERCFAICGEMVGRGLSVEFDCYSRINTFDEELGAKLKRAGCRMVWFGIESGSDDLLIRMRKGQTRRQAARAVSMAKRSGLEVCCNILIGHPGETRATILDTLQMLAELRPERLSVQRLRVMPGTDLFDWCREQGVLDEEAWILEDRDFCYERDFSRQGLDNLVQFLQQMEGDRGAVVNEDLAKYLILKASKPVCRCRLVGEEELRFAVQSGASSLEALKERTGAMSGCGSCVNIVATLLHLFKGEKPSGGPVAR